MSFWSWFKSSQTPRSVRKVRADARSREAKSATRRKLLDPHYYVFYYPPGREPGSGWKYPKSYFGPFDTTAEAKEAADIEVKKYGEPRSSYKIRRLTSDQFSEIWGAAPGEHHPGY